MTYLATLLAVWAASATLYALHQARQMRRLSHLLVKKAAKIRQLQLRLGHVEDAEAFADKPIEASEKVLDEAGITDPTRSVFERANRKKVVWVVLLASSLLAGNAHAADRLGPGTVVTRTDGAVAVLDGEYLLMDHAEAANLAVMVRDLQRCREALEECDATGKPIVKTESAPWGWVWTGIAAGFVVGITAGAALDEQ